jgi:hypothetical protein
MFNAALIFSVSNILLPFTVSWLSDADLTRKLGNCLSSLMTSAAKKMTKMVRAIIMVKSLQLEDIGGLSCL